MIQDARRCARFDRPAFAHVEIIGRGVLAKQFPQYGREIAWKTC